MGRLFFIHLEGRIYSCKHCQSHIALSEDIVSKILGGSIFHDQTEKCVLQDLKSGVCMPFFFKVAKFIAKHGKAYLFSKVVNVTLGVKEERMMMTGMHTVSDIFCVGCGSIVGWKYESAHEKGQKYKEGRFILERFKVSGPDGSNYWINHDAQVGGSDTDDA